MAFYSRGRRGEAGHRGAAAGGDGARYSRVKARFKGGIREEALRPRGKRSGSCASGAEAVAARARVTAAVASGPTRRGWRKETGARAGQAEASGSGSWAGSGVEAAQARAAGGAGQSGRAGRGGKERWAAGERRGPRGRGRKEKEKGRWAGLKEEKERVWAQGEILIFI